MAATKPEKKSFFGWVSSFIPNPKPSISAFDGIAPSAPQRTQNSSYHVFINHPRCPDVKHTLASVLCGLLTAMSLPLKYGYGIPDVKHSLPSDLCDILTDMALSVFLGPQEFEYGDFLPETIEVAISGALVHIAIFSKGYADSPRRLAELTVMLKSGAKIIPIFYHVDPTDLRWVEQGKGIYVQAFQQHAQKGRYSPEQLQEWKSALHKVSYYHGEIIRTKEDETRLLKNVVGCIVKEVKNKASLVVAEHPVGLKEIVKDFEAKTLNSRHGNQDVQIIGIWGMGGSGKTTLAKELFNEISVSMKRSSFIFDVRDATTKDLLHEKQKQLLNDLGIGGVALDNIERGITSLSNSLRSVKVLIVLDDVDSIEQLYALLPHTKDSFGKDSLVIVTTREYEVLQSRCISSIYKMGQLDPLFAKQLFCWHAFLKSYPPKGFNEIVEKFVKVCNGLPLSLKVFGSQLYGELRKDYWESQFHKISGKLPEDIKKRLQISYDNLDDEEKEMFLDISCFFIGQECSLVIELWNRLGWNGLGWDGLISWKRLLNKCLVELDNNNHISMHNHIRDLGQHINASKQLPYRLHLPQQIFNIQQKKEEKISIRGMVTTTNQIAWNIYWEGVNEFLPAMVEKSGGIDELKAHQAISSIAPSLAGLKYLVTSGDHFTQVSNEVSKELIWLRWFQMKRKDLPPWRSLENLRVLELCEKLSGEEHNLEMLWGESGKEVPVQLRQLLISGCTKLKGLPKSIKHLEYLKKIVISDGSSLSGLPDEFCLLQSLEHLVLHRCEKLSSVPHNFGDLKNLRSLSLLGCHQLKRLPISFHKLTLLEHLNLQGCTQLTFTSEEFNFLEFSSKLEFFNISYCEKVEKLPHQITNQASLKELYFSHTSLTELPKNIGQLSSLRELKIEDVSLKSLPSSFGDLSSLTNLKIENCDFLECLPRTLGNLSSLTNLKIENCHNLHFLPKSISQLSNLQDLSIFDCPITQLELPFPMRNLKKIFLEKTEVSRISLFEDGFPQLEHLYLIRDNHLKEIEMKGLTSLREFSLRVCPGIQKIEGLENCKTLEGLSITSSLELPAIESFEHVQNLKYLHLQERNGLDHIDRCIQTIQKWPDEIMICARTVPDAASLVRSLLPPNTIIIHSISNQNINSRPKLVVKNPSSHGDCTFIFCFVINCVSSTLLVRSMLLNQQNIHLSREYTATLSKGRWTLLGVFTQRGSRQPGEDIMSINIEARLGDCGEVKSGLVWRGEENTRAESFRSLLPLFPRTSGMENTFTPPPSPLSFSVSSLRPSSLAVLFNTLFPLFFNVFFKSLTFLSSSVPYLTLFSFLSSSLPYLSLLYLAIVFVVSYHSL